ncbi:MAG: outer membrane beta-barrel protein, partial [Pricia sp.]|nr:outer membrane beta-barrel protein [Pricia sp.]
MKRFFFLLGGILFLSLPANAQFNANPIINLENKDKNLLNYGYFLGFNQYGFKFSYENDLGDQNTDIQVLESIGFNVGLIGEMRFNEFLDLRIEPGLYYNART